MSGYITTNKVRALRHLRRKGWKIGTTNGCFDLMHPGHVRYLRDCKRKLGKGILVVLVNDDRYCEKIKGADRPVYPQALRAEMVRSIKGVWFAWLFRENNPSKWIRRIRPDVHFKGEDWQGQAVPEAEYAPITFIPLLKGYSTTEMIRRLKGDGGERT